MKRLLAGLVLGLALGGVNAEVVQVQSDPLNLTVTRNGCCIDQWGFVHPGPWAFPEDFSIVKLNSAAWRFHGTIFAHAEYTFAPDVQPLGSVAAYFPRNVGVGLLGVTDDTVWETWVALVTAITVHAPASQCLPNASPCVMHMERTFDITIEADNLDAFLRQSPFQPHIFGQTFTLSADPNFLITRPLPGGFTTVGFLPGSFVSLIFRGEVPEPSTLMLAALALCLSCLVPGRRPAG